MHYGSPADPHEPFPTRQAAIANAWASYARNIEAENDSHRQIAADSEIPKAIRDVLAERKNNIEVLRRTAEKEDEFTDKRLAQEAEYIISDYKSRRDLVQAGVLIIAEIERLDRLAAKEADHE